MVGLLWPRFIRGHTNTGYDRNNVFANSILATHVGEFRDSIAQPLFNTHGV